MKIVYIFVLLSIQISISQAFIDYGENVCLPDGTINVSNINLHVIDAYIFSLIGPLAILSSLFIIVTFIIYPASRKQPGDIIFMISLSDFILASHWTISATYFFSQNRRAPDNNGPFCQTNAIFSVSAGFMEFLYNCSFCFYIVEKITNVLKPNSRIHHRTYHVVSLGLSLVGITTILNQQNTGKSLFGTCSIQATSKLPLLGPTILIFYVILSSYTLWHFKRNVKNSESSSLALLRKQFLDYYQKYIYTSFIIWTILCISQSVVVLNCSYWRVPILNLAITIGNISKLLTPLVLSYIRLQDPFIKQKMLQLFYRNISPNQSAALNQPLIRQDSFSEVSDLENNKLDDDHIYDLFSQELKVIKAFQIISGILLNQKIKQEQIQINLEELKKHLPEVAKEIKQNKLRHFDINMQSLCQNQLQKLIDQDQDLLNLSVSLNLTKNYQNIIERPKDNGGRGGEFLFSTFDNKIILKTMSEMDLKQMLRIADPYQHYLTFENNQSSIAKIYGIYKFKDSEGKEDIIMMMRNLSGCSDKFVVRRFDMKGSSFQRRVIKDKNPNEQSLKGKTLKDLDFLNFEKTINVRAQQQLKIREIMQKDSDFLQRMGLIDYSILLIKVDRQTLRQSITENKSLQEEKYFKALENVATVIRSDEENEKEIYYHIGIIDYLQVYDQQKFVEKYSKKFINCNPYLDTSSQDPTYYCLRFNKFVEKITQPQQQIQ